MNNSLINTITSNTNFSSSILSSISQNLNKNPMKELEKIQILTKQLKKVIF